MQLDKSEEAVYMLIRRFPRHGQCEKKSRCRTVIMTCRRASKKEGKHTSFRVDLCKNSLAAQESLTHWVSGVEQRGRREKEQGGWGPAEGGRETFHYRRRYL